MKSDQALNWSFHSQVSCLLFPRIFLLIIIYGERLPVDFQSFQWISGVFLEKAENKNEAPKVAIWSLDTDDMLDDDLELINDDDLLDENDLKKPDPSSLRGNNGVDARNLLRKQVWRLLWKLSLQLKSSYVCIAPSYHAPIFVPVVPVSLLFGFIDTPGRKCLLEEVCVTTT